MYFLLTISLYTTEFSSVARGRTGPGAMRPQQSHLVTLTSPPGAVRHHRGCLTLPLPGLLHLDAAGGPEPLPHCTQPDCGQLLQHEQVHEEVHVPCGLRSPSSHCGHFCSVQASPLWNTCPVN